MKKVFLIFAIILANCVFTSCTDLDENLEREPIELEISATDGEDEQLPDDDDDDTEIGD
jgi:hypothetical protein